MGAFHAYDIRGIYNKDFDKETVYKVGYFLPQLLGVNNIAVGRDARTSSPEIHEYLLKGITDAGADVTDIGLATTPMVYFATAKYGFGCSVQITASHNPREYNGLKVSRKEALPVGLDSGLGEIERWIAQGKETPKSATPGKVICKDIKAEYLQFQSRYKGDYSNLNIGIDLSNGMAALIVKDLIPKGENVAYIYDTIDGSFPNHDPNPLVAENVEALKALVAERGCDIGVIYDGDADRVMFVDEKSRFIAPDLIIALMGHYWLEKRGLKGRVLQDIRSSKSVGEYLVPMGAQMATWRVGRAFAAPKLREIDGVYGGEFAGHYYFKEFFYSDSGIMASLIVLSILSDLKREGKTLSQVIDKIAAYNNSGEINFKIERKAEAMEAVKNWFTSVEKPTAIMDFDGYRVEFPDWWFNIRPSNTEPYLRLIAEAKGEKMLQEKVAKAREIIESFK
ncbi:MAG: phosphomannomutase/phosphoglucomutase [Candidatus Egerieousia sp.]|nr:phosphomannomutase/phosphoglucomutase [bacterium]MDY5255756.1 phosphomannomutase/phosphoglucomutase [Candidatus Egerieousia sp.]